MDKTENEEMTTQATDQAVEYDGGELLTLAEVAKRLKISRKTLYAWKSQGKIRLVKVAGSLIRVPLADLAGIMRHDNSPIRHRKCVGCTCHEEQTAPVQA